ncbi:hypothetical protein PanWU01x14_187230, partial [Parasponia andersonii]
LDRSSTFIICRIEFTEHPQEARLRTLSTPNLVSIYDSDTFLHGEFHQEMVHGKDHLDHAKSRLPYDGIIGRLLLYQQEVDHLSNLCRGVIDYEQELDGPLNLDIFSTESIELCLGVSHINIAEP